MTLKQPPLGGRIRCLLSTMAIALLLVPSLTQAADTTLDRLSKQLVDLRTQVQTLSEELQTAKTRHKNRLGALARQQGSAEVTLGQAQTQLKQLQDKLAEQKAQAEASGSSLQALQQQVEQLLATTRQQVQASLPFKREARLAQLDELKRQLAQQLLTPQQAMNRLWDFYADEIRLTRDLGLYRQTVKVNGQERLAEVARLGMVAMFYRTEDQQYGKVVRRQGEWQYQPVDAANNHLVAALFKALEQHKSHGYFLLPNVLGELTQPLIHSGSAS